MWTEDGMIDYSAIDLPEEITRPEDQADLQGLEAQNSTARRGHRKTAWEDDIMKVENQETQGEKIQIKVSTSLAMGRP